MPSNTKTPAIFTTHSEGKNNKAMNKFRRLKTIMKKMVQTSKLIGLPLSLLVLDKKLNKITEYTSESTIKLENIHEKMDLAKNVKKRTRTNRALIIRSVDANEKFTNEN